MSLSYQKEFNRLESNDQHRRQFKILIVDDNIHYTSLLSLELKKHGFTNISIAHDKISAIRELNDQPDLVLMDVYIDENETGLEIIKEHRKEGTRVIFVTSSEDIEDYTQAQELECISYLVKPLNPLSIVSNLEQIYRNEFDTTEGKYILCKRRGIEERVPYEDIMIVEALREYVKIHTSDKVFVLRESMKKLEELLGDKFLRIHRQYIINLTMVQSYDQKSHSVIMNHGKSYPIATRRLSEFRKSWRS